MHQFTDVEKQNRVLTYRRSVAFPAHEMARALALSLTFFYAAELAPLLK